MYISVKRKPHPWGRDNPLGVPSPRHILERFTNVSKHQQGADNAQAVEPQGGGEGGEKRQP
jgi:hypothetical protein